MPFFNGPKKLVRRMIEVHPWLLRRICRIILIFEALAVVSEVVVVGRDSAGDIPGGVLTTSAEVKGSSAELSWFSSLLLGASISSSSITTLIDSITVSIFFILLKTL
jgi:hypothetical protein